MIKYKLTLIFILLILKISLAQNYNEVFKAVATERNSHDYFSSGVSISGNYAIVGAYTEDEDEDDNNPISAAGSVFIYKRDSVGEWHFLQKIVASDRGAGDRFGTSVSISDNYVIIGASNDEGSETGVDTAFTAAGSAYIFEKESTGFWIEKQKILASDRSSLDRFGLSVSISGGYAIVGAFSEDNNSEGDSTLNDAGAAYVFERNGDGLWEEQNKLVSADRDAEDYFGHSVSISGNYAIVGAYREDDDVLGVNPLSKAGSAYIFERDINGNWVQKNKITPSDRDANDYFGFSVAISGNYALIGAYLEDDYTNVYPVYASGSAYFYVRDTGGNWVEENKVTAMDRQSGDYFGYSVSLSGSRAVIGAYQEDNWGTSSFSNAGSAYVFKRNSYGIWDQKQKITASDRNASDLFGYIVSISGDYIIAGAFWEDEDANGNNTLSSSGSAYIFDACQTTFFDDERIECYSYTWIDGNTYFSSTDTATVTLINASGCDSIVTLNLTILGSTYDTHVVDVCDNYTWVDGNTYTTSNSTSLYILPNAAGCDSLVTLNLTVNNTGSVDTQVACDEFAWIDGNIYLESNYTATHILPNAAGCDSIISLDLSVFLSYDDTKELNICLNNSYVYADGTESHNIDSNESHTSYLFAAGGCDSIISESLYVKNPPETPLFLNTDTTLCINDEYFYHLNLDSNLEIYHWQIPQAWLGSSSTNEMLLTCNQNSGYIIISGENVCGTSEKDSIYISVVTEMAAQPSPIIGPNPVCMNSEISYSVENIPYTDYFWELPLSWSGDGNKSLINLTTGSSGGMLTIVPFNACGVGVARVLDIDVNNIMPVADFTYTENQSIVTFNNSSLDAVGHYWDFGDGEQTWSGNPVHDYVNSGQYLANLTVYNSCGESSKEELINLLDLSVGNKISDPISIYPNPSNGKIFIKGALLQSINITNVEGKKIEQIETSNGLVVVDLSKEAKGIYFFFIRSQNETIIQKVLLQ